MHRKMEEEGSSCDPAGDTGGIASRKGRGEAAGILQHGYDQMKANFEALQEFLKEE